VVAFFFLFFLHGTSIGNGQQGISYNVEAAWRSGGLIVHPFISALMIVKCTKVWLW